MSNEKPTVDLDQLRIIRGLLELDSRFRGLEQTTENVRTEVQRLNVRMSEAEQDIRDLRDKDAEVLRHASNVDLAHEAALGGAITHVQKLEQAVQAQGKVNEAVCAELGLDHQAIVSGEGPASIPPKAAQKTTLKRIDKQGKAGTVAGLVTLLLIVAQIIAHVMGIKTGL